MKTLRYLLLCIIALGVLSCQRDDLSQIEKYNYDVTITKARDVAGLVSQMSSLPSKHARDNKIDLKERKIKEILPYPNEGSPAFYIINYVDNRGFILLAADKRSIPILASSADGNFILNDGSSPDLKDWVSATVEFMQNIDKENKKKSRSASVVNPLWDGPCPSSIFRGIDPKYSVNTVCELEPCNYGDIDIAPKINSTWGQGVGYNDYLNHMSCIYYSNGKPPVGCVATAMG